MRRGFTRGARTAAATVCVTAVRRATCLLCDAQYDSWGEHAAGVPHIARSAICRTYVAPERHGAMIQQLWKHIRLDFEHIDDVTHKKEDRRRGRLASTMRHLQQQGVLRCSIPIVSLDANGSKAIDVAKDTFVNYMLLGESYAQQETIDRVARLMPRLDAMELSSVVRYVLSKRRLARLFDELDMQVLLKPSTAASVACAEGGEMEAKMVKEHEDASRSNNSSSSRDNNAAKRCGETTAAALRLRQDEKSVILLSCLGELQMFSRQDRSHSVASRAAAEQLVLNVLGTHVTENIVAELVHGVLQSVVEEGTPVWRAHCSELTDKLFEGTRAVPSPLAASPASASPAAPEERERRTADLCGLYALDMGRDAAPLPPTVGRQSWHDVSRALALELTVPSPVNKSAVFAAPAPRLQPRKKNEK